MTGLYVYHSLSLYYGLIEIDYINNKTIVCFFNLWSKKVIENISDPSTVHQIDIFLDARIIPTSVVYIISIKKWEK